MTAEPARRLDLRLAATVSLTFLLLVGLGVWQVQRLAWKTEQLRRIDQLSAAPAKPLADILPRLGDPKADLNFVRVQFDCPTLEQTPALNVYAIDESGQVGDRVITACKLARESGVASLLVDRGFTPKGAAAAPPGAPLTAPVVGVLRRPPAAGLFAPKPAQYAGEWMGRDLAAMAAELKAERPAPYFLLLERPLPASGSPKPAPLAIGLSNNHLGYAITWFGLAAALVGVYIAYLRRKV